MFDHLSAYYGYTTLLALPSSFCYRTGYSKELYIYIYARSIKSRDYIWRSSSFFVCSLWFLKNAFTLMLLHIYSNRFLMLCNHTGMVVPRGFHSCCKLLAFDQIQLDAYCAVVWRRFEATFKLRPVIPIFERNEMTECPWKTQLTSRGITWHIQPFSAQAARSVSYRFFFRLRASSMFYINIFFCPIILFYSNIHRCSINTFFYHLKVLVKVWWFQ